MTAWIEIPSIPTPVTVEVANRVCGVCFCHGPNAPCEIVDLQWVFSQ